MTARWGYYVRVYAKDEGTVVAGNYGTNGGGLDVRKLNRRDMRARSQDVHRSKRAQAVSLGRRSLAAVLVLALLSTLALDLCMDERCDQRKWRI